MRAEATKKESDTAYFANFCADWTEALDKADMGRSAISKKVRRNTLTHFSRPELSQINKGMRTAFAYGTISRAYRVIYEITHSARMRNRRDIAALRGCDAEFGLFQMQIAPERIADKVPSESYRPEFSEIARELCLTNITAPLDLAVRNIHLSAESSVGRGPD